MVQEGPYTRRLRALSQVELMAEARRMVRARLSFGGLGRVEQMIEAEFISRGLADEFNRVLEELKQDEFQTDH
jgi:hypothetical protein